MAADGPLARLTRSRDHRGRATGAGPRGAIGRVVTIRSDGVVAPPGRSIEMPKVSAPSIDVTAAVVVGRTSACVIVPRERAPPPGSISHIW